MDDSQFKSWNSSGLLDHLEYMNNKKELAEALSSLATQLIDKKAYRELEIIAFPIITHVYSTVKKIGKIGTKRGDYDNLSPDLFDKYEAKDFVVFCKKSLKDLGGKSEVPSSEYHDIDIEVEKCDFLTDLYINRLKRLNALK